MDISFLIGSGFSIPYGMPSVTFINNKFRTIKPEEIYYGLDRFVTFLDGKEDVNGWMKKFEKDFFVEFIDDYCNSKCATKSFNYEEFFDYYYAHYCGILDPEITKFCNSFRSKNPSKKNIDDTNLLLDFHNIFSQLLAALLRTEHLYENNVQHLDYGVYTNFVNYVESLINEGHTVDVHTLNHDLLLDHMCQYTDLSSEFCDGFSEIDSPYYGSLNVKTNIKMKYKVRVKQFVDAYDKRLRLYKLHGSIDNHWFIPINSPMAKPKLVKSTYGVFDFWKEVVDPNNGKLRYQKGYNESFPSFLSGTTTKISQYGEPFYNTMLDHFEKNLGKCDKLIIIGYGFWDDGINDRLRTYCLNRGITPRVFSPSESQSPFYQSHKFNFIPKGIQNLNLRDFS